MSIVVSIFKGRWSWHGQADSRPTKTSCCTAKKRGKARWGGGRRFVTVISRGRHTQPIPVVYTCIAI
eukprot:scaffold18065_cov111-Isochrysis_galbana.AAC.1